MRRKHSIYVLKTVQKCAIVTIGTIGDHRYQDTGVQKDQVVELPPMWLVSWEDILKLDMTTSYLNLWLVWVGHSTQRSVSTDGGRHRTAVLIYSRGLLGVAAIDAGPDTLYTPVPRQ
jgi:hypothetical protein